MNASVAAAHCAQCGEQPGRYKCSICENRGITCSAACSKLHKASHNSDAGPSKSFPKANGVLPTGLHDPSSSTGNSGSLDHRSLLSDYLFLSRMSRTVAAVGKQLSAQDWADAGLKESMLVTHAGPAAEAELSLAKQEAEEREAHRKSKWGGGGGQSKGKGRANETPSSRDEARRELLMKQARYKRLSLVLLPTGMHLAKLNRSCWLRKEGRMSYSVELKTPRCCQQAAKGWTFLFHHQTPESNPSALLLDQMQKMSEGPGSHPSQSNQSSRRIKRVHKQGKNATDAAAPQPLPSASTSTWIIRDQVWKQVLAAAFETDEEAIRWQKQQVERLPVENASEDQGKTTRTVRLADVTGVLQFCIPLVPAALRNETSRKHREWYERQIARGAVEKYSPFPPPVREQWQQEDDAHATRAEGECSEDQAWHAGVPTGPRAQVEEAQAHAAAQLAYGAFQPQNGLISGSLLSKLSEQIRLAQPPLPLESPPAPLISTVKADQESPPDPQQQDDERETKDTDSLKAAQRTTRTVLKLGTDASLGIEEILQRMPDGFAVVEYPIVEIYTVDGFKSAVSTGAIQPRALKKLASVDQTADTDTSDESSSTDSSDSDDSSTTCSESDAEAAAPAAAGKRAAAPLPDSHDEVKRLKVSVGLAHYATDSEEEGMGNSSGEGEVGKKDGAKLPSGEMTNRVASHSNGAPPRDALAPATNVTLTSERQATQKKVRASNVPTAKVAPGLLLPYALDSEEEEEGAEDRQPGSAGAETSLASLARQLGFARPRS